MTIARLLILGLTLAVIPAGRADDGKATLVWISMDGVRGDYLARGKLPFFTRVLTEGAYSRQFQPSFPPITFPSHCSEATGVTVEHHGITGNGFYDSATQKSYRYPAEAALLQAEPIWLTATRQGVRTLVYDWPLSQAETGAVHAAYFNETFDNAPSDVQRLDHLLDTWRNDNAATPSQPPLRLIMGYVEGADPTGHQAGPDSPLVTAAMEELDTALGAFQDRALALWKERAGPADRLYFLFTTDHGMSKVEQFVHLEKMLGVLPGQPDTVVQTVGNMGNVFVSGADRDAKIESYLARLRAWPFVHVYRREELPRVWGYAHSTRVGDLVALLPKGYTYTRSSPEPVSPAKGSPMGMHGYPLENDPEMQGVTLLLRYPQPLGGKDLGQVWWDQYHPTAARLLGIAPAEGAGGKPLALPGG